MAFPGPEFLQFDNTRCVFVSNFLPSTCQKSSSHLTITTTQDYLSPTVFTLEIEGVNNPRSLKPITGIVVSVSDASGEEFIASSVSTPGASTLLPQTLQLLSEISLSNSVFGQASDYTFHLRFHSKILSTDHLLLEFPS